MRRCPVQNRRRHPINEITCSKKNIASKASWNVHMNHESPRYIQQLKILTLNNLILLWIADNTRLIALKHRGHNLIMFLFSVYEIIKLRLLFLKVMKEASPTKMDLND
jgi:hypothetical protein